MSGELLLIVNHGDQRKSVGVPRNGSVYDLKAAIKTEFGIDTHRQQLFGLGESDSIQDDFPLQVFDLRDGHELLLLEDESSPPPASTPPPPVRRRSLGEPTRLPQPTVRFDDLGQFLVPSGSLTGRSIVDMSKGTGVEPEVYTFLFEEKFGHEHPSFQGGELQDVLRRAEEKKQLVVVQLMAGTVDDSMFNSVVVTNPSLRRALVNNNAVWWVGNGQDHAHFMDHIAPQFTFPFVAILGVVNNSITLFHHFTKMVDADTLVGHLVQARLELNDSLQELERERREREEARLLKEEQDNRYRESLQQDLRKEMDKKFESTTREILLKTRLEPLQQAHEYTLSLFQGDLEGPPKGPEVAEFLIRLPDGSKIKRCFPKSSSLMEVFHWIGTYIAKALKPETFVAESSAPLTDDSSLPAPVPWDIKQYVLVQNYPKARYEYESSANISVGQIGGGMFFFQADKST